jgi:homoserine kinase
VVTPAGLIGRRVTIESPASTANLGAGFDALAMALDLVNVVDIEAVDGSPGSVELAVEGEGAGELPAGRSNRLIQSLGRGLAEAGVDPAPLAWRVSMRNAIPLFRGLGSSASVTIAGLLAARELAADRLDDHRVLALAASLEGHPDNVAAALLGGFVVVTTVDGTPRAVRFDPPSELLAVLYIPDRPLSTAAMRAALPASVPFADAVHNVGASSLAVAAMASGRLDLLAAATVDRLHEPYRAAAAYPELPELVAAARRAGALGACLSGAGSTVIAFADDAAVADRVGGALAGRAHSLGLPGASRIVRSRRQGARVVTS